MTTATTATATSPTAASAKSAVAATATTVSVDVADLIRILQVQLPQLHNESVVYEHKVQMEDTKEQYRQLCKETDSLRKKLLAVVQDNNNYRKTQERMESQIYAQQQELAQAHKETQALTRQRKHLEKRLENELHNYESDRLLWQQRESDLRSEVKRWSVQDRAGQHPRRTRSATASNIWARTSTSLPEPQAWGSGGGSMGTLFEERTKPIDSVAVRDTKIRAQEKLISDFKSEVEQQERVIHEAMLAAEAQTQRIETLEQELTSLKEVNASLMEDNESYQILLHEKTMAGEFPKKSDLASTTSSTATTATAAESTAATTTTATTPTTIIKPETTSLAAELNKVQGGDCTCQHAATVKKLSDEIRVLQESNKALSLYMNKILLKIVDNQELVDVLNIDEDDEVSPHHPAAAAITAAPPSAKKEKTAPPPPPSSSSTTPTPTEKSNSSVDAAAAAAANNNRPRRSTISSWISAPKQPVTGESTTMVGRHRSHTNNDGTSGCNGTAGNNNNNNSNSSSGGWSRALKRMTVIGWSTSKDSSSNNSNFHHSYNNNNNSSNITPASHDSAISSCDSVILEE